MKYSNDTDTREGEGGSKNESRSLFPSIVPALVSFINVIPMYEMGGPFRIYLVSFLPIYCRPFVPGIRWPPLSRPLSPVVPVENLA